MPAMVVDNAVVIHHPSPTLRMQYSQAEPQYVGDLGGTLRGVLVRSSTLSTVESGDQFRYLVVGLSTFLHLGADLVHGVDDRRVVPATELTGNCRVGEVGELAHDVHRHLTSGHQRTASASALDVF